MAAPEIAKQMMPEKQKYLFNVSCFWILQKFISSLVAKFSARLGTYNFCILLTTNDIEALTSADEQVQITRCCGSCIACASTYTQWKTDIGKCLICSHSVHHFFSFVVVAEIRKTKTLTWPCQSLALTRTKLLGRDSSEDNTELSWSRSTFLGCKTEWTDP